MEHYGMENRMTDELKQHVDEKLSTLLRAARPMAELPPRFQNSVWRRIESGEVARASLLERLADWIWTPRLATAGLALVIVLAAGAGAARGVRVGEREARDRYVTSVDPSYLHR